MIRKAMAQAKQELPSSAVSHRNNDDASKKARIRNCLPMTLKPLKKDSKEVGYASHGRKRQGQEQYSQMLASTKQANDRMNSQRISVEQSQMVSPFNKIERAVKNMQLPVSKSTCTSILTERATNLNHLISATGETGDTDEIPAITLIEQQQQHQS